MKGLELMEWEGEEEHRVAIALLTSRAAFIASLKAFDSSFQFSLYGLLLLLLSVPLVLVDIVVKLFPLIAFTLFFEEFIDFPPFFLESFVVLLFPLRKLAKSGLACTLICEESNAFRF